MGGELTDDYTILTRYPELENQDIQSAQDIGLDKTQTKSSTCHSEQYSRCTSGCNRRFYAR